MLFAIYFVHLMWNSTLNGPKYLFKFADECNLVPRAFSLAWKRGGKNPGIGWSRVYINIHENTNLNSCR